MLEMDEQFSQSALDGFQVVKPGVGGVELFDQLGDAIFEMAQGHLVASGERKALELFGKPAQHAF